MRKQSIVLENHSHVAFPWDHSDDVLSANFDLSAGHGLKTSYHPHGRGFAASGRTDQDDKFALGRREIEILDGKHIAVPLHHLR